MKRQWFHSHLPATISNLRHRQAKLMTDNRLYQIREIRQEEIPLLTDFLYEAIFRQEGAPKIPRTVIQDPMIWAYVDRFGSRPEDFCLVALADGLIVGAVWSRPGCSYGKTDESTPELAISVYPEYRGRGIGTRLLSAFLDYLAKKGFDRISLSVDKSNYAVRMYEKAGFRRLAEREHDYLMIRDLQ